MAEKMTDADFGYPAWRGFVEWSFKQPSMRAQFAAETGRKFPAPNGDHEAYAKAFTLWVSEAHWGLDEAPEEVRRAALQKDTTHG